jgi:hypothetical protein
VEDRRIGAYVAFPVVSVIGTAMLVVASVLTLLALLVQKVHFLTQLTRAGGGGGARECSKRVYPGYGECEQGRNNTILLALLVQT